MTGSELDLHEALTAIERALGCETLEPCARRALAEAGVELRLALARGPRPAREGRAEP